MKRAVIGAALIVACTASTAHATAPWASPHELVAQMGQTDGLNINRSHLAPLDGPILPGQMVSVTSLAGLRVLSARLPVGTWVMYDPERWDYTPEAEQAAPYQSMRRFVVKARASGFVAVLAPGGAFRDRAIALNLDADLFIAQIQKITGPIAYGARACEIARTYEGRLYVELSAGPGVTASNIAARWRRAEPCVDGFALWGVGAEGAQVLADALGRLA